jgi:mono/diheme cytochrome c family protein
VIRRAAHGPARLAAALVLGLGALVAAGCGGDGAEPDLAAGKQAFTTFCASCHTLEDAGTPPSSVGPNLDDAFRASRQAGIHEEQFAGLVKRWIRIAQLPMPRDLVTGEDSENVAAYIASVAGRSPDSAVRPAPPETPEVPSPDRQELQPPGG